MYVNENLCYLLVVSGTGMIGIVHDNPQMPAIYSDGIELATGFKHRLTYVPKTISYLQSPYTTCTNQIPPSMKIVFTKYYDADYEYSESLCFTLCGQIYRYDRKHL